MRTLAVLAALLLTAGSAQTPSAPAPCTGQVQVNPSFERGPAGWTAGPRVVVLAAADRPAHTGRAYATFAGLDLTHSDLLRSTVTIPAGCGLDVRFSARGSSTETSRGDYLNMGLAVTGEPPKTRYSFAFDLPADWHQYGAATAAAATERTATISFFASETAGGGVTTFDVDDVTATLQPAAAANM
ncbi:hypothetical protein GCM10020358_84390 [Amorphoplanes nipponensis]|uniref:CBM11 domain-containing protein n=1 Tax=Actinoplanes nipponensis TaxID=135950 RepID=A0A919MGM6_9ACTN|nr:hypothetical protein [Actinoplanes nipponensis]GIE48754.1 hypothetical protein Ani05nite_22880 [Actinoplanes nipponensis]